MRLAGKAKAGFYPTPLSVTERIITFIKPAAGPIRMLDPCCGLGDPLQKIARHLGAESYGIELDRERAAVSEEKLHRVIQGDALTARVSPNAFSLLFLNPPYDQDERRRLEYKFLVQATAWLAPRGMLIYLIPQGRYHANTLRYLARSLRLYRFPDDDYQRFKQTVLFAVKKARASFDLAEQEQLKTALNEMLPVLPRDASTVYTVPSAQAERELIFRSSEVTPEEVFPEIDTHGVWLLPEVKENLDSRTAARVVRPLMPLRKGHLAQLIAAGFINNQVLEANGKWLLIKGRTIKESVDVRSGDEDTTIERDVIRTTIMALDEKGHIIEIGEGG
jgi:predicted RNA methylase